MVAVNAYIKVSKTCYKRNTYLPHIERQGFIDDRSKPTPKLDNIRTQKINGKKFQHAYHKENAWKVSNNLSLQDSHQLEV